MITAPDPTSFIAPRSSDVGPGPSLTSAAASSADAPLDTAMATARVRAESRSEGSATVAAAYERPVSSLTAAPSADPTRALADRAKVMIFRSSGPSSSSVISSQGHRCCELARFPSASQSGRVVVASFRTHHLTESRVCGIRRGNLGGNHRFRGPFADSST
jgi:hypothetical protein